MKLNSFCIAKLIWDEASAKRKKKIEYQKGEKTQYIMGRIEEGELAHVCLKISFMEEGKERMEFSEKLMGIRACLRGRKQHRQRDQGKTSSKCDWGLGTTSVHNYRKQWETTLGRTICSFIK